MGIPGTTFTSLAVRAKVKIGEKRESKKGVAYPAAVDKFLCDDEEFQRLYPQAPSRIEIRFPYAEPSEVLTTGLEWYKGQILACYTHDGGHDPTAYRVSALPVKENGSTRTLSWVDPDDEVRGNPVGRGRTPIKCRFRECRHFGSNANQKECKPKARLVFLLPGGRTDQVLQFETSSWNTIEALGSTVESLRLDGPLNQDRRFALNVAFHQHGDNRYPVVSIEEVKVEVNSPEDVLLAERLLRLRVLVDQAAAGGDDPASVGACKHALADVLDLKRPGWRDRPELISAWVGDVGLRAACESVLEAHGL